MRVSLSAQRKIVCAGDFLNGSCWPRRVRVCERDKLFDPTLKPDIEQIKENAMRAKMRADQRSRASDAV